MLSNQTLTDEAAQEIPTGSFDESNSLFQKIRQSLEDAPLSMTESDIWEMLAAEHSMEWIAARDSLRFHEADLQNRLDPDNIPLGLIGAALDAGELDQSRNRHSMALAGFTVINEDLRQDEELKAMMTALSHLRDKLQVSHELSQSSMKLTSHFASAKQQPQRNTQYAAAAPKAQSPAPKKGFFSLFALGR